MNKKRERLGHYCSAACVLEAALDFLIRELNRSIGEKTLGDVCRAGDEFVKNYLSQQSSRVKGIALPVELCKNELVRGIAPEAFDAFQGGIVLEGDVVTISLGIQVNGYAVLAAHTVVIRENRPAEPFVGSAADAYIASILATEAVVNLLASALSSSHPLHEGAVTAARLKKAVEDIAKAYNVRVCPKSQVRRIKRYVVGQIEGTSCDGKLLEWPVRQLPDFTVTPGETYVVDISMAAAPADVEGSVVYTEFYGYTSVPDPANIYVRDFTQPNIAKGKHARRLIDAVDARGVFPFKISYVAPAEDAYRRALVGLHEAVDKNIIVPQRRLKAVWKPTYDREATEDVVVARKMTTVFLMAGADSESGYNELWRFGDAATSWVHSRYELEELAPLVDARNLQHTGVMYKRVGLEPGDKTLDDVTA